MSESTMMNYIIIDRNENNSDSEASQIIKKNVQVLEDLRFEDSELTSDEINDEQDRIERRGRQMVIDGLNMMKQSRKRKKHFRAKYDQRIKRHKTKAIFITPLYNFSDYLQVTEKVYYKNIN